MIKIPSTSIRAYNVRHRNGYQNSLPGREFQPHHLAQAGKQGNRPLADEIKTSWRVITDPSRGESVNECIIGSHVPGEGNAMNHRWFGMNSLNRKRAKDFGPVDGFQGNGKV